MENSSEVLFCSLFKAQITFGLLTLKVRTKNGIRLTEVIFFLDSVRRLIFDEVFRFGSRVCFGLQAIKVPSLVYTLYEAI